MTGEEDGIEMEAAEEAAKEVSDPHDEVNAENAQQVLSTPDAKDTQDTKKEEPAVTEKEIITWESGPAYLTDEKKNVIIAGSYVDVSGVTKVFVREVNGKEFIEVDAKDLSKANDEFKNQYNELQSLDLKPDMYKMWTPRGMRDEYVKGWGRKPGTDELVAVLVSGEEVSADKFIISAETAAQKGIATEKMPEVAQDVLAPVEQRPLDKTQADLEKAA